MTNEFIEQIFALKNRDADPEKVDPDLDPTLKEKKSGSGCSREDFEIIEIEANFDSTL